MGSIFRPRADRSDTLDLSHPSSDRIPNPSVNDSSHVDPPAVPCDYFDGVYDYIKQMLMEEDDDESDDRLHMSFHDFSALQACENYFYDALWDTDSVPTTQTVVGQRALSENNNIDSPPGLVGSTATSTFVDGLLASPDNQEISNTDNYVVDASLVEFGQGSSCGKKSRNRGDGDDMSTGCRKQLASFEEEAIEPTEEASYDKAFLCEKMNPGFYDDPPDCPNASGDEVESKYKKPPEARRGRPKGTTKKRVQLPPQQRANAKEVVDLRTLLTRCAEAVSRFDGGGAQELLENIRRHSSPYGDANERLAHCFANALEARLAGTGSMLYASLMSRHIPASDLLKAYRTYVTACPFQRMSNIFANKTIAKHTRDADKIHIVDFGILYGFQWPCIIQGISLRPGGPPALKITGVDFPQPGFKPVEKVEQTGRRLASYCKRFKVPFEYNAVAKKWEEITEDDLNLEHDEALVVNCLYRLRHVPDESTGGDTSSPRDAVLKLIKKLKPCIFVHGVVNGTYNAPFFTTRFREALYHYSSFFDMMEATLPKEDPERLMYEREVFGKDVMNVIACEGWERVDRPESYKLWRERNRRTGFRKVPLDRDIMNEVKIKVKKGYQCEYMVEEDDEWMLQGWKGRPLYALSCWKP
ncbi:scarecrow-like protein 30 [Andrographis paniculata]|uniref:scarecrow-like protein 30 n=1 Tax=Andrographis paniculata TaxID=175694 RepID=UPI0021E757BC|nr:scarecrow-like protein 30 [Andrographis paniculata]